MPVAVFKKLKKSKEKECALPEPEPVKTVDSRTGFDTYRDFYTLKNYWKAVTRNKDAGLIMMTRWVERAIDEPHATASRCIPLGQAVSYMSNMRSNIMAYERNALDYRAHIAY
uniref:Integrase n=1 Tax=Steinernema glaseri TaxID=37863 RepID=A0A1I8ASY7_9BILA